MKNLLRTITLLLLVFLAFSCQDDELAEIETNLETTASATDDLWEWRKN